VDSGEERFCIFKVSRGNSTPLFQMKKSIFNKMPYFVQILIVVPLNFSISFGWNNRIYPLKDRFFYNRITVISLIRKEIFCFKSID